MSRRSGPSSCRRATAPAPRREANRSTRLAALRPLLAKIRQLEIELQHLVFDLYGLTPEEVQLLRSTAQPSNPLALVEARPLPRG